MRDVEDRADGAPLVTPLTARPVTAGLPAGFVTVHCTVPVFGPVQTGASVRSDTVGAAETVVLAVSLSLELSLSFGVDTVARSVFDPKLVTVVFTVNAIEAPGCRVDEVEHWTGPVVQFQVPGPET
ncbi:MAG TPA: hypothetical protein VFX70_03025 [Mycobacteriales bacterium]|nr:hypothetical protein [Mycobacteriales bacterium]